MKDLNKEYKIYAADVEATGLLHHLVEQGDKAKLHNLCVMDIADCNMTTFHTDTEQQRKDIQALLDQPTIFIMHNGICYDKNALKHFGYDVSNVIFVDTLALSWYLDLNRDKHGLENYGEEFGTIFSKNCQ
jgi:DNA polymerase III alpha subunit (gram-positive type)